jgi:AraC family transcriptional regulator
MVALMPTKATQAIETAAAALISHEIDVEGLIVRLLPRAPYCTAFTPSRLVIGFAFDVQSGDHAFASDRILPFVTRPATAAVTPPGCEVYSSSNQGGEYLTVEIAGPETLGLVEGRPAQTNLVVPRASQIARRLRVLLVTGQASALGAAESAQELAGVTLDAAYGGAARKERGAGSLTDQRLRKLNELIEARLGDRLTIGQMAAALGLQPRFFLRAFRAATGTTPHAYLLERRLETARQRLKTTNARIASIAAATGFASQAHLDYAFGRAFELTPSAFRKTFG